MKFRDIKQLTRSANYRINVGWSSLKNQLEHYCNEKQTAKLNLDPDFQRAHVWTEEQQVKYVEFKLKSGEGSNILYFNCVGWMNDFKGPFVLVDGKQRLNAVLRFLNNEIKAFGQYYNEYEDRIPSHIDFVFTINDLRTEKDVLQWYLDINSGGVCHTEDELNKVRKMLDNPTINK